MVRRVGFADNGGMVLQMIVMFALFFFALGACIGSFLNVVIWRLPHRGSVVTYGGRTGKLTLSWPPSHCPHCDTAVRWWQNVPVLAWVMLRGKCAGCGKGISIRYPLVELATGVLFSGLFLAYFVGGLPVPGLYTQIGSDWGPLALHLFLIAALLAASAIDADLFIIPLEIPWVIAAVAVAASPFVAHAAMPVVSPTSPLAGATIGGVVGLILANVLLWRKMLPRSFAALDAAAREEKAAPVGEGQRIAPLPSVSRKVALVLATAVVLGGAVAAWVWLPAWVASVVTLVAGIVVFLLGVLPREAGSADVAEEVVEEISVPEARREIAKELLFVAIPVLFAVVGMGLVTGLPDVAWLGRLLGSLAGLLVGGGIVWLTRIGGSLLFGKEAMGLGDIHLMAGVGAVIGWPLVLVAFFVFAPLLGLVWGVVLMVLKKPNVLPYGPWLSIASMLALVVGEGVIGWYLRRFVGM